MTRKKTGLKEQLAGLKKQCGRAKAKLKRGEYDLRCAELDQKLAEDIDAKLDEEVELPVPLPVPANSSAPTDRSKKGRTPPASAALPSPESRVRSAQKLANAAMRRYTVASAKYERLLERHGSTGTKRRPKLWRKGQLLLNCYVMHIVKTNQRLRDAQADALLAAGTADYTQLQLEHAMDEVARH